MKLMNNKKYTFEEPLELDWKIREDYNTEDPHIIIFSDNLDIDMNVVATLPTSWGDFKPVSHSMDNEEYCKVINMLFHAKEMYSIVSKSESPKAKELVEKINSSSYKENLFVEEEGEDED